jgi:hypothetical protein
VDRLVLFLPFRECLPFAELPASVSRPTGEKRGTMKRKSMLLLVVLGMLVLAASSVSGQSGQREFQVKRLKQYWLDQNRQPWNDTSYRMAVRIDPQYAKDLGTEEISTEDPQYGPTKYEIGKWLYFSLNKDAKGTYADVNYLVYKDSSDLVVYQIELQKGTRSAPFAFGSSKFEVHNDSVNPTPITIKEPNKIFLKDWLFIGVVMLLGLILVYVLVFRWLFSGLLFRRRWAVPSAEHFTWSMSLLVIMGLAAALTLFYLGPRLETWLIIGVLGAFWLLHGVVWLVSGKEA